MNNQKRKSLEVAVDLLNRASEIVSVVLDDELDSLENMPENLQAGEKYERMEEAVDKLDEAIEQIDRAQDCINEASE